jgi:hypothetical protein
MTLNDVLQPYLIPFVMEDEAAQELKKAITAHILSLLPKKYLVINNTKEEQHQRGYNQCLADIKERIEKEMVK